eukprot:TRINITY_DN585_c0_g2_i1.p1 TRINITY_DN585_c0_g2~~TRINITY_DN585_c0_g2_i1.p1  ORF type:complete len:479 (-),score=167.72 TRINITY_DN585_c0_g2_i1:439-1875(-)
MPSLVGSEMCIRDRVSTQSTWGKLLNQLQGTQKLLSYSLQTIATLAMGAETLQHPSSTTQQQDYDKSSGKFQSAKQIGNDANQSRGLLFFSFQYYMLPALITGSFYTLKYLHNPYIMLVIFYVGLPLLDIFLPPDLRNPTKEEQKKLEKDIRFRIPLYICIILEWIFCFWTVNFVLTTELDVFTIIGSIFLAGNMAASSFVTGHELNHSRDPFDKLMGCLGLTKLLYLHWYTEHNYGHHKYIATPKDPAFSRLGESVYEYYTHVIPLGYKSAWNIEKKRLLEIEEKKTHWTWENKMIWFMVSDLFAFPALVIYVFGFKGFLIYLPITFIGIIYLETINYIEHYGLERKEISPGVYEKVNITHSWNAPHRISNYVLLKLQRHSDHHENAYKPYQTLCTYDESPQLPQGYTVCIILAFVPSVWFKVMNNRAIEYRKNKRISAEEEKICQREIAKVITIFGMMMTSLFLYGAWKQRRERNN